MATLGTESIATAPAVAPEARSEASPPSVRRTIVRPLRYYLASRALVAFTMGMGALGGHMTFAQAVDRWDSQWFLLAASKGWPRTLPSVTGPSARGTIAFFPVYPLCCRWLAWLTHAPLIVAATFISLATGAVAMLLIWRLVDGFAGPEPADKSVLLLSFFPGSFIFNLDYAEGTLLSLVALGLLLLRSRRWLSAGLCGLVATATAPIGLAFGVSALWCSVVAIRTERAWRSILAPVLVPVGFVVWQIWLWRHTGRFDAWRVVESEGWKSSISPAYPFRLIWSVVAHPLHNTVTTNLLVVGIAIVVVASILAIRAKLPAPVLVYGLCAAAFACIATPVGARPRFIFDAFPLVIAMAISARGRRFDYLFALSVVALLGLTLYSNNTFAVFP